MKKLTVIFSLLILSLNAFAQHSDKNNSDNVDFVIIELKLGAVLGGYKNGKFIKAKDSAKGVKVGEDYTLFGFDTQNEDGAIKLTKMNDPEMDICPEYYSVETNSNAKSGVALSSNARWNATPRIPKAISPNNRVYRGIVRKFLRSQGIRRPKVNIQKILRIDLEGDGQDEVLIQANNRPENIMPNIKRGDYSFILLRKIVDGRVKNIVLTGDFHKKNAEFNVFNKFELSSILDLDADGKMEIVTYGAYYEGAWAEAYKVEGGKVSKVLETGCGV